MSSRYPLLPCHLDVVGKLGVGSAGHHWRKPKGRGYGCSGVPCWEGVYSRLSLCSWRLGEERIVPHSVVGTVAFFVFLLMLVWARHGCRATSWRAVLAAATQLVEVCPLMKPWCAEEDVPTAANLNLSCVVVTAMTNLCLGRLGNRSSLFQ